MSTFGLRIPDSTHNRLKDWVQKDKLSINQFISAAVAEKLAALQTLNYLSERAQKSSKAKYEAALAAVQHAKSQPQDR